ncbi:MAG: cyclic nucleotide-binding domain-containing protein, partial [Ruegeria sp.]|nr:cyclic nucleotide-binding domain-containing protein [Ruegeria sp.]
GVSRRQTKPEDGTTADLSNKLRIISSTELFSGLDARNQRLLAFSAQWYEVAEGQMIFSRGQAPDAAYLCIKGSATLEWSDEDGRNRVISTIEPGRLIGDLSIITGELRQLDLTATTDCIFLRIGAEELRAVIESDVSVAVQLLQTVAGYFSKLSDRINTAQNPSDLFPEAPHSIQGESTGKNA